MPDRISCERCQATLNLPEGLIGKQVMCPSCQQTFVASRPTSVPDRPAPLLSEAEPRDTSRRAARRPFADDEDEDDLDARPSRRRRASQPLYPYSDRSGLVLALGIGSLVLVLLSCLFALVIGFLPVALIGMGLAVASTLLGRSDLAAMRNQQRDPSGEGMTNAGMICGIIGMCLNGLLLLVQCGIVLFVLLVFVGTANHP